jgi:nucleotide-binding universal stress UspA family protein/uncharacterized protein YrrD
MFQHVIVPLDGSVLSEQALDYAAFVASQAAADVTLLRAFEGTETTVRDYLDRQAASLRDRGISVETLALEGKADDAILAAAAQKPGTLIVMCTHGRGGLARLVFGSTASSILTRASGPLLLIPVREDLIASGGRDLSHDIRIGAHVRGTSGDLGTVHRVIVDARTNTVTDIVVRHGFAFRSERIVPLEHVSRVDNGTIELDLDNDGFAGMNGFTEEHFHAPDPDYQAPPGFDRGTYLLDTAVLTGSTAGFGQPVPAIGFPGGEETSPDVISRPTIVPGDAVLDIAGEKAGEVGQLSVEPSSGQLTRLTVRHGFAGRAEVDVPLTWIQELSDKGVVLNVPKEAVEGLAREA